MSEFLDVNLRQLRALLVEPAVSESRMSDIERRLVELRGEADEVMHPAVASLARTCGLTDEHFADMRKKVLVTAEMLTSTLAAARQLHDVLATLRRMCED